MASIVEEIFLLLQINWKRGPEKSIQNPRSGGINETKRIPTPSGQTPES